MRTTIAIDDALYEEAMEAAEAVMDNTALVHEALKTFVRVQAAKRLASLDGGALSLADIFRGKEDARQ